MVDILSKLAVSIETPNFIAGSEYNDCRESNIEVVAAENVIRDRVVIIIFYVFWYFYIENIKKNVYNY